MRNLVTLNDNQLKKKLTKMHALDIANLIKDASPDIRMRFINLMSLSKTSDVFLELPKEIARNYFNLLSESHKKNFLNEFEMDDLKVFINSFDEMSQAYLINLLPIKKQRILQRLMSYDDEAIASIMTTEFITIDSNMTIKEATSFVINNVKDSDYIDSIFVTSNQKLIGFLSLKDLISARPNDKLNDITYLTSKYLTLEDSIYQGFLKFKNYSLSVLPVLDDNLNILGIVTADDMLDEMIDEYEEDIEKMQAIGDYDIVSSASKRAFQRLPWLLVSVVLNLIIALFLSVFETTLEEVIALILFQPMILGMAGNIGTQSISVTILKLNQDELVDKVNLKKHLWKEISIGLLNSITIGLIGILISFAVLSFIKMGHHTPFDLSLTIGISLFGAMFISSLVGVFIPIVLNKFKIDPAIASGPIISTLNDLFALLVYFGLATLMFM